VWSDQRRRPAAARAWHTLRCQHARPHHRAGGAGSRRPAPHDPDPAQRMEGRLCGIALTRSAIPDLTGPPPHAKSIFATANKLLTAGIEALWPGAAATMLPAMQAHNWMPSLAAPAGQGGAHGSSRQRPPVASGMELLLRRHCPGVALPDLLRWALVLRISTGISLTDGHEEEVKRSPAWQGPLKGLLRDCQWLLDVSAGRGSSGIASAAAGGVSGFAFERATHLLYSARQWETRGPQDRHIEAVNSQALECARSNKCWLAGAEIAL
ncbi:hypothetical protein ABPG75_013806, partial [Micractinium tetrahymenae]